MGLLREALDDESPEDSTYKASLLNVMGLQKPIDSESLSLESVKITTFWIGLGFDRYRRTKS